MKTIDHPMNDDVSIDFDEVPIIVSATTAAFPHSLIHPDDLELDSGPLFQSAVLTPSFLATPPVDIEVDEEGDDDDEDDDDVYNEEDNSSLNIKVATSVNNHKNMLSQSSDEVQKAVNIFFERKSSSNSFVDENDYPI